MVRQLSNLSVNGSETGKVIHAKDWSKSPLGPMKNWPQSLCMALQICLLSDSPASICWGVDHFFFCNDAWKDLFRNINPSSPGQPGRDVLGVNWKIFEPYFDDILKKGEIKEAIGQSFALSNEEEQTFSISFSPVFNEHGSTEGVFSIAKVNKEDSPFEIQLPQDEGEFYDFFENAPIALHWIAPDETILKANQAELDMLGYSQEEYIGRNITDFYADKQRIDDILQRLEQGEVVHNVETQMIRKDGSIVEVSISSNVLRKDGEFIHTRCFTRDITEQKRRERRLGESEYRYRTLVNYFSKGAVGLFDEDLRYTAVGGELVSQLGVNPEDRIGVKITDIYPDETVAEVERYFRAALNGEANLLEAEFHGRNLFVQILPVENDEGEVVAGMVVVQDVTEHWQAQKDLRESEAKFRMMAENLNEVIWMISGDREKFIYINPAFEKVWGIDREKLYDERFYYLDYIHPEDLDRIRRQFEAPQEEDFDNEIRIIRPDGEVRWLHPRSTTVVDEKGEIDKIIGIAEDITKRKHAELQLRKSKNRLSTALNIDTVGVIFWNWEDRTISEANDAFLNMSGFTNEEVRGLSWKEITPEEFYPISEKAISDIEATGHTEPYEKQCIRKDGTRWWGLFAPRKIDENEVVQFVIDITNRKEAEEKLEAWNRTLEERVEKRTQKLRAYQYQLRSLASQLNKAEERERQRLATELHDTLGQMLTVAKMKVEGLKSSRLSDPERTDLDELKEVVGEALRYNQNLMVELKPPPALNKEDATEVLYWTAKNMEKKGLEIEIEDDGQSQPVDREIQSILHQSVRELFQNVLKHADTQQARMEIIRENEFLKVTVKDNGRGFDPKKNWLNPTEGGRFGIFNIKERLNWHGGRFEIYSEPGKGTQAVIYAPLKEDVISDQASQEDRKMKLPPGLKVPPGLKGVQINQPKKIKILLADDHEMVRRGLCRIIEKQDDIVILGEASNGRETVELARSTHPDIILMDINMPVMDGIEATQVIKDEMPNIRIIGLSLHESGEVIENMHKAGASAYLTKGEAIESLITTIRAESAGLHD